MYRRHAYRLIFANHLISRPTATGFEQAGGGAWPREGWFDRGWTVVGGGRPALALALACSIAAREEHRHFVARRRAGIASGARSADSWRGCTYMQRKLRK